MKRKTINVNWILTTIGVLLLVATFAQLTFNWENAYTHTFAFYSGTSSSYSDYIDIGGTLEVTSFQKEGTSSCKYSLYEKARVDSSYNNIYSGVKFANNNEISDIWTVKFGNWKDYKFKMNKQAGASVYSVVDILVGIND